MTGWVATMLADGHTNVPSEAVGSGLGVWWLLVSLSGVLTVACCAGFFLYLRRTAPKQQQTEKSTVGEAP